MKSVAARATEQLLPVSLADAGLLVVVFLLACATFAIEDGLVLRLPAAGGIPLGASGDFLRVVGRADGGVEIGGRTLALDAVRFTVGNALARNARLVVLVEAVPGARSGLVAEMLEEVRLAGATRVSLRRRGR